MYKITSIFPKAVYSSNIQRPFTEQEISLVEKHRNLCCNNIGNIQSIDHNILNDPYMCDIKAFVIDNLVNYYKEILKPRGDVQIYITQSWLNYTKPDQFHHKHKHPNSILSGVVYLQTDPSVDKVTFYKDDYERVELLPEIYNQYNASAWFTSVSVGDILIFPSELSHMVETKKGTNERVSLAFNTFVKGHLGDEQGASALHLR